jgi:hypothetical protein
MRLSLKVSVGLAGCGFMLGLLLLASTGEVAAQLGKPGTASYVAADREVQDWIDKAVDAKAGAGDIALAVRNVPTGRLAAVTDHLNRKIKKEETCEKALALALLCQVPGLFDAAKSVIEKNVRAEREEPATKLAALSDDPSAAKYLAARWLKAEETSKTFEYVNKVLLTTYVDTSICDELIKVVKDEKSAKRVKAAEIIAVQARLKPTEFGKFESAWARQKTKLTNASGRTSVGGVDLIERNWNTVAGLRRVKQNLLLNEQKLDLTRMAIATKGTDKGFVLKQYVCVLEDGTASFKVLFPGGWTGFDYKEGAWNVIMDGKPTREPVKTVVGEWVEIKIVGKPAAFAKYASMVITLFVNGKGAGEQLEGLGLPTGISFVAGTLTAFSAPGFDWN